MSLHAVLCQNPVFTDPHNMAIQRNPAQTGAFLGSLRVSGAYRRQWPNVNNAIYTSAIGVDGVFPGLSDQDWIGVGGFALRDELGDLNLRSTQLTGVISYHKALDRKRTTVLSAGVALSFVERGFGTLNNAVFLDELNELVAVSPDRGALLLNQKRYFDIDVGLHFRTRVADRLDLKIDASSRHVNRPDIALLENDPYAADIFYRGQVQLESPLRSRAFIGVDYGYLRLNVSEQHRIGGCIKMALSVASPYYFEVGGGALQNASWYGYVGMHLDNTVVRLSYDRSRFFVNNQQTALELTGAHIFRLRHKPKIKPTIFCPRF